MTCRCVGGRLEPNSPTIIAASTYNQHYDEYDQKCSRVHDALLWPRKPSRVRVHQQPPVLRVRGWLKEHQRPCPRKQQVPPVGHQSSRPITTILRQALPRPLTTHTNRRHSISRHTRGPRTRTSRRSTGARRACERQSPTQRPPRNRHRRPDHACRAPRPVQNPCTTPQVPSEVRALPQPCMILQGPPLLYVPLFVRHLSPYH